MLTYEKYSRYRDAKHFSDHEIAYLTGIQKSTFSAWKREEYNPKLNTLLKIAKLLKIPPHELVSKEDISKAILPSDEQAELKKKP